MPEVETPEVTTEKPEEDLAAKVAELQKQLADEKKAKESADAKAKEYEATARHWYDRANKPEPNKAKAADDDDDVKLDVDLSEVIVNNDAKSLRKALRGLGLMTAAEVEQRIASTREQITREAQFFSQYPELNDQKSALFSRTKEVYNELSADPNFKSNPSALAIAARIAKAELGKAAPVESEEDRVARVRSQQGASGARHAEDEHEELSDMQRDIIAKFKHAGARIDEKSFTARAKAGVRLGGNHVLEAARTAGRKA